MTHYFPGRGLVAHVINHTSVAFGRRQGVNGRHLVRVPFLGLGSEHEWPVSYLS